MVEVPQYRIREAVVEVCNGFRGWHAVRFIAERKVMVLGLFGFWWPVLDGEWRRSEEEARRDADTDAKLRAPRAPAVAYQPIGQVEDGDG